MKSFVVGTVLEPEIQTTKENKVHLNFGLLVGKHSTTLDVWEGSEAWPKISELTEGAVVLLVVSAFVDEGKWQRYRVNDIVKAPEGLRQSLLALFQPPVAAPQQPQQEQSNKAKAG